MKVSKSGAIWILVATVVSGFIFANLIGLRHFVRLDLTKDGKYTLSDGSRETMRGLNDAMVVTAYFTEGLPAPYASYSRYVRDLLEEYRAASDGKLAFEFIDPSTEESEDDKLKKKESVQDIFGRVVREPTSVESELIQLGIQPVEIRVIEDDQQQTKRAYMGLVIRYQGKKEVLPIVQDFSNFEKDMTVLMRKLVRAKTPVIGLINDLSSGTISKLRSLMSQTVEVKELNASELKAVPAEVDALVVIGSGRNLHDEALKAIDDFVVSGKNVAFFIDQFEFDPESLRPRPAPEAKSGARLRDLLDTYGVSIGSDLVADTQCASLNVQEQRGSMVFGIPVKYPFMPQVMSLDQESPVTRGLAGAIFPFASPLTIAKDAKVKVNLLAESSKKSWLESEPFNTDPKREWRAEEIKSSGPFSLIVDVRGQMTSHFAQGEGSIQATKPSRILVAGTSAFAWDQFFSEENQALAIASIDYLVADDFVLAMRSRSFVDLPLDPELSDEKRNAVKLANIFGVPALLVLYGILRWRRRERKRRLITIESIK